VKINKGKTHFPPSAILPYKIIIAKHITVENDKRSSQHRLWNTIQNMAELNKRRPHIKHVVGQNEEDMR